MGCNAGWEDWHQLIAEFANGGKALLEILEYRRPFHPSESPFKVLGPKCKKSRSGTVGIDVNNYSSQVKDDVRYVGQIKCHRPLDQLVQRCEK